MEPEFESLLALGFQILSEGPRQVLLCRTADQKEHYVSLLHVNKEDHTEEDCFLAELAGKQVTHILVLWDSAALDIPSPYFCRKLKECCPGSQDAQVLLQTGSGQMPLPLSMLQ